MALRRDYGALLELLTRTNLLAIIHPMYTNSLAPRYDIGMGWHTVGCVARCETCVLLKYPM